jgi:hypothetical protein
VQLAVEEITRLGEQDSDLTRVPQAVSSEYRPSELGNDSRTQQDIDYSDGQVIAHRTLVSERPGYHQHCVKTIWDTQVFESKFNFNYMARSSVRRKGHKIPVRVLLNRIWNFSLTYF